MSQRKVPVILIQLYGVPAPKALGLRVLEAGLSKDQVQSGKYLGHHCHEMYLFLKSLQQEGYALVDIHQKMRSKPGSPDAPKTTPVVYLTYQLGGESIETEEMAKWLQRMIGSDVKAADIYLNQSSDKDSMLSINLVNALYRGDDEPVTKIKLYDLIWVEDRAEVVEDA